MNMDTNQNPFYQNLKKYTRNGRSFSVQREEEYLKQKNGLNNLLEVIKQEKSELERAAKEQEKKREELKKEEQNQQTWYQQICEERKQIDMERGLLQKEQQEFQAKKDAAEVQYRVQLEKAKNEGIQMHSRKKKNLNIN